MINGASDSVRVPRYSIKKVSGGREGQRKNRERQRVSDLQFFICLCGYNLSPSGQVLIYHIYIEITRAWHRVVAQKIDVA